MGEVGPPDDRISPRVIFQDSKKENLIVEPRGRLTVKSGRPRSSFQKRGRGRQGSSAIDAPAGGPSLPMTIKARRFTLAGFWTQRW